jgi:long-chain acyl-CoA synthetase
VAAGRAKPQPIRAIFFWALKLGHAYELHGKNGAWYTFKLKIADALVFKKWRAALGGEAEVIVTGAAALQPRLARVFTAAGISVLEGYGLTETSPVITVNQMPHSGRMFGSVGPVIDGVQVKIAEDGEILCKGPNVMMGYYNKPEATAEVMDADGWFHTGDIGEFREGKFLAITDRKKEVFKTSGGKYIAPQPMENAFKESLFIEQIMVVGPDRNFPSALISPAWEHIESWLKHKGLPLKSPEELVNDALLKSKIEKEIHHINQRFGQWEQVKKFVLIPRPFSIEGGELTPTLKLRRKNLYTNYAAEIESMYAKS